MWNQPNIMGFTDYGKYMYAINVMLDINNEISYIIN